METLNKIKKHGFIGTIKAVGHRYTKLINVLAYYISWIFPINNELIVMESEGDLSDNAYALYDYMLNNGYLKRYKVVWLVDDVEKAKKRKFPNTTFVKKTLANIDFKRSYYLGTCRRYIYDHCNLFAPIIKRKKQQIIYLSHGWGYKAAKGADLSKIKTHYDFLTSTGPISAKGISEYWGEPLDKAIITGYPRMDYFYDDNRTIAEVVNEKWNFDAYNKTILWMPTFRQSNSQSLSEDYITNQTGLPIFETRDSLYKFSLFLKENNMVLVLKLHHLQANLPIFKEKLDNILIVRDEDLQKLGIQLYQFVSLSSILISDYSSIAIDYLVINKPIIFTLDDYDEYDKSRGLSPKNAIDYMKGYHVYNVKELEHSLMEIDQGIDKYAEERKDIIHNYHTYLDGNSSKRVLKALGIDMQRELR